MGIIEAKNLVHEYIQRDEEGNVESIQVALDHMDLAVEPGQFIAVLGHNGSGKSTFAKHINALLTPSEGTLFVDGMDVLDETKTYDIRQRAGMVFQNPDNQIIASVVQEDVGFGPENIGVPTEEIWQRVERSLKAVGMWKYREHSPNKLSGGQKQRVAIARALVNNPAVLLADEPTGALDQASGRNVMELFQQLNEEGVTVIMITHDAGIAAHAKQVIHLVDGQIVEEQEEPHDKEA
jgi:energy-coupling factor transporter ATPase